MKEKIPILIFVMCFILSSVVMATDDATVKVIRVVDGDTIQVKFLSGKIEKVRLIGIDTPETVHPNKPVEYFGKQASNYTKRHLEGKQIKLTYDWNRRDRYGRLLAYIWVNGKLFNNQIIREGYAHAYLKYPFKDKYMKMFRESEQYARNHKLGLWGGEPDKKPVIKKIPSGVKFVVSKKSNVFHRLNCKWAKKIKPGNRIYYKTRQEAIKAGKRPCKVCKP